MLPNYTLTYSRIEQERYLCTMWPWYVSRTFCTKVYGKAIRYVHWVELQTDKSAVQYRVYVYIYIGINVHNVCPYAGKISDSCQQV